MVGIEAGQSAVGDLFDWCARFTSSDHDALNDQALRLGPGQSGLLALDWNNGNRTVLVDPRLTGLLVGQTLSTTAAEAYRAMIEATAFGARRIIVQNRAAGVAVDEVVVCGGIADKSALAMQIYADVCQMAIRTSRSSQTCALGSAIAGSVAGRAHPDVPTAVEAMVGPSTTTYSPDPSAVDVYDRLYRLYLDLHDGFGVRGTRIDLSGLMKDLLDVRESAKT
jgi:L-ribulokinase